MKIFILDTKRYKKEIKYRIFKNLLFAILDKKQYFCPH